MKKIITFLLFILFQHGILNCQVTYSKSDTTLLKVRVTTSDWRKISGTKLNLFHNQSSIVITDKLNTNSRLELSNIYTIEQQKGTRALFYGLLFGAGAFLISSQIAYMNDDPDDFNDGLDSSTIGTIIIGGTGLGLSIGFLIGHKSKKYKRIYYNGQFNYHK
jgi:hypothetical protein